jgi:hypothetical protein
MLANPLMKYGTRGYTVYQPDQEIMAELMTVEKDDLTITVVLGTLSRQQEGGATFMKMIDLWGFPRERIRFIGVDINKIAPLEDYGLLSIERVPTFIFL